MIRIACNKCGIVLELDDAFAGGVCRCGTCGAIQHVPKDLKAGATPIHGESEKAEAATSEAPAAPAAARAESNGTRAMVVLGICIAIVIAAAILVWRMR